MVKAIKRFVRAGYGVLPVLVGIFCPGMTSHGLAAEQPAIADFRKNVQPILSQYCYDCHADGANKGNIAFDELKSADKILDHDLWLKVLKNTRAGLMPPQKKPRPSQEERQKLEHWIKYEAFGIDPKNPDPGRVTVHRLNRIEYKNTIRDLMGVDYDAEGEFPAEDTGYGFDNIADVLTLSPMLLEKYLDAASTIVGQAVPTTGAAPKGITKDSNGNIWLVEQSGNTGVVHGTPPAQNG